MLILQFLPVCLFMEQWIHISSIKVTRLNFYEFTYIPRSHLHIKLIILYISFLVRPNLPKSDTTMDTEAFLPHILVRQPKYPHGLLNLQSHLLFHLALSPNFTGLLNFPLSQLKIKSYLVI